MRIKDKMNKMKGISFFGNIKSALYSGLAFGVFHGSVDVIARLIEWNFEWYELYQTLFFSMVSFVLIFLFLGLAVEIASSIFSIKKSKSKISAFYFTSGIFLLLIFYLVVNITIFYFVNIPFFSFKNLLVNILVIIIALTLYILTLLKFRVLLNSVLKFIKKKWIAKVYHDYIFFIVVFIGVSFFMDVYLTNNISEERPSEKLNYPNILIVSLDTLRADHMSLYGYGLNTTPNIDRLAKDSVVFNNAISSSSWSLESHAGIFTGRYAHNHGASNRNQFLKQDEVTIAEFLRSNGYATAGFTGNSFTKTRYGFSQGFLTYKDRLDFFEYKKSFDRTSLREPIITYVLPFIPPVELSIHKARRTNPLFDLDLEKNAEEINELVFKWIDKNKDGKPFFMFINYIDAHTPYNLGNQSADYDNAVRKEIDSTIYNFYRYKGISNDTLKSMNQQYDTEIYYLDYNFGKLLEKLEESNLLDNTIIIVVSDHGEELYEHGGYLHGTTLYQEVIHVPFVIYYPDGFKPAEIKETVSLIDIFPTIQEMLDLNISNNIDGISLVPLISTGSTSRGFVISEVYGREGIEPFKKQTAVLEGDWKLIKVDKWNNESRDYIPSGLYNLRYDPEEKRDVSDLYSKKREQLEKYIENFEKFTQR